MQLTNSNESIIILGPTATGKTNLEKYILNIDDKNENLLNQIALLKSQKEKIKFISMKTS